MGDSRTNFKDSLDELVHGPFQGNKSTPTPLRTRKPEKKTVVINEEKNQTHVIQYGGDPLYKLELKAPKKGILKPKRYCPEGSLANLAEASDNRLSTREETSRIDCSEICPEDTTNGYLKGLTASKRDEFDDNTGVHRLRIPLCQIKPAGRFERLQRGDDSKIYSPNSVTLSRNTSMRSSGSLETFGDYCNNTMSRVLENSSHRSLISPRFGFQMSGSMILNDNSRMTSTDLNYVPPQFPTRNHTRHSKSLFSQSTTRVPVSFEITKSPDDSSTNSYTSIASDDSLSAANTSTHRQEDDLNAKPQIINLQNSERAILEDNKDDTVLQRLRIRKPSRPQNDNTYMFMRSRRIAQFTSNSKRAGTTGNDA